MWHMLCAGMEDPSMVAKNEGDYTFTKLHFLILQAYLIKAFLPDLTYNIAKKLAEADYDWEFMPKYPEQVIHHGGPHVEPPPYPGTLKEPREQFEMCLRAIPNWWADTYTEHEYTELL
eukprot:gene23469-9718_t